jgi:hypothetical protein
MRTANTVPVRFTDKCEVYTVREKVWTAAGMEPEGGCLCVGCLEKRLGRALKPKDFERDHPFNVNFFPGTPRLLKRRGSRAVLGSPLTLSIQNIDVR